MEEEKKGNLKNGEYKDSSRWCTKEKQFHGPLYDCKYYPKKVREEIARQSKQFIEDIPKIKDLKVREIMKFFAGT